MILDKLLLFFLLVFGFSFCNSLDKSQKDTRETRTAKIDTIPHIKKYSHTKNPIESLMEFDKTKSYSDIKKEIQSIKSQIDSKTIARDSLSKLFTHLLVQKIIPYWYGTSWSFEGHSSTPQEEISCGYFVSTTLKDVGFNLNRFKFAQQRPINEAKSISISNPIFIVSNPIAEDNISTIRDKLENGIFFIGFNGNHVGYLYKEGNNIYIIHSNYLSEKGVMIENIEDSAVFSFCENFYIADISANNNLLKKWLLGKPIKIVTK